jgi:uncharacterized membrane protein YfcA
MSQLIALTTLGLASGLLIGCIGIGGVILVPGLVFIGGVPIHRAIPAALLAYVMSGFMATAIFARQKSIRWSMAAWLCLAAAPAAFAGALVVKNTNARLLEMLIGVLTAASGLNSLRREPRAESENELVAPQLLLLIGASTGFVSSMSGTGGPLVLVPILMALNLPVLTVIGLSQAIQLPIAIVGTFGNYLYGELDWYLGCVLALALMIGSWQGARLAHIVDRDVLRRIVSVVLILIGAFILANVGVRLVGWGS